VNEVIQFALGDRAFSSTGPDAREGGLMIISDMRRAVDAAGGVGPESSFAFKRGAMERLTNRVDESDEDLERGGTWRDLGSFMVASCIWTTEWYEWRKKYEAGMYTIGEIALRRHDDSPQLVYWNLASLLPEGPRGPDRARSRGYYREYVADYARSDLMHCAENRAYNGMTDNFWEQLFQLYRRGFWPCGWHGTWPSPGVPMVWRRPGPALTHRQPLSALLARPRRLRTWLRRSDPS
jgi:hypothetical protein